MHELRLYLDENRSHTLLLLLARATDKALARYVQFLEVKNHILRSNPPRVVRAAPHNVAVW